MTAAVLTDLDLLKRRLLEARAHIPNFGSDCVGKTKFRTGLYYMASGFSLQLHFSRPLTEDDRDRLNRTGRWINETGIVGLVATLVDHGVLKDGKPHTREVANHEHVTVARDLRSIILKEGGRFKAGKPHHQQCMNRLVKLYRAKREATNFRWMFTAMSFP
jgi:hypothetical protein